MHADRSGGHRKKWWWYRDGSVVGGRVMSKTWARVYVWVVRSVPCSWTVGSKKRIMSLESEKRKFAPKDTDNCWNSSYFRYPIPTISITPSTHSIHFGVSHAPLYLFLPNEVQYLINQPLNTLLFFQVDYFYILMFIV